MRLHRGVLYYGVSFVDLDGNPKSALMGLPLTSGNPEPEILVESEHVSNSYSEVLPYGNYIYYNEKKIGEDEIGQKVIENQYFRYQILDKTVEKLEVPSEYRLFGVQDKILVFYDGKDYYEYDPKTGKTALSSLGAERFQEAHRNWRCYASGITDKIAFMQCEDITDEPDAEYGVIIFEKMVTDSGGNLVCSFEEPASLLPHMTSQIIHVQGKDYYLRFSAKSHPFSTELYDIDELLAGDLHPITLLSGEGADDIGFMEYEYKTPTE